MRGSGKTIVAVVALGVMALLLFRLYRTPERALRSEAVERRAIALRVLAEHVAEQKPGCQALVMANPFALQPGQADEVYAFEKAALRGLEAGWAGKIRLAATVHPELAPLALRDPSAVLLPPDATTPLSFMTTEQAWDDLYRAHPDVEVWISLIGLPAEVTKMEIWRGAQPQFALLLPDLRVLGNAAVVKEAFRSGKLLAIVLNRPDAPPETVAREGDYRSEFARRFLLVTSANADELL